MNTSFVFIDTDKFNKSEFSPSSNLTYVLVGDDIVFNSINMSPNISHKKIQSVIKNKACAYLDEYDALTAYIKNKKNITYSFSKKNENTVNFIPAPLFFYQYCKENSLEKGVFFIVKPVQESEVPKVNLCFCDSQNILISRNVLHHDDESLNIDISDTISVLNREYSKKDFSVCCIGFDDTDLFKNGYIFPDFTKLLNSENIVNSFKVPSSSYFYKKRIYFLKSVFLILAFASFLYFFTPFASAMYSLYNIKNEISMQEDELKRINTDIAVLESASINDILPMNSFEKVKGDMLIFLNAVIDEPFELKKAQYVNKNSLIEFSGSFYGLNSESLIYNIKSLQNSFESYRFENSDINYLSSLNVFKTNLNVVKHFGKSSP